MTAKWSFKRVGFPIFLFELQSLFSTTNSWLNRLSYYVHYKGKVKNLNPNNIKYKLFFLSDNLEQIIVKSRIKNICHKQN